MAQATGHRPPATGQANWWTESAALRFACGASAERAAYFFAGPSRPRFFDFASQRLTLVRLAGHSCFARSTPKNLDSGQLMHINAGKREVLTMALLI